MIVRRNLSLRQIAVFTGHHLVWLSAWATLVAVLCHESGSSWISIPFLPMTLIGTAVAFYLGFKNNSAYQRMWEARKIWGGIVNSSRAWGSAVRAFVGNRAAPEPMSTEELGEEHRKLIYRHIAWTYELRSRLLVPVEWEHSAQTGLIGKAGRMYRRNFGVGLVGDQFTRDEVACLLAPEEFERLGSFRNGATQLLDAQAQHLKTLREKGHVEDLRHIALQQLINDFYVHQGKCERIKKFPLPRQYAGASKIFVGIFIALLPISIVSAFGKLGSWGVWLSIPVVVLVSWIYLVMELIGDYSENPFQGLANDIPMLSICRTVEIDLREMLGETDLPQAVQSKEGILM